LSQSNEELARLANKCKLVIAVSGPPGSGKTTIAKKIAEVLKLRYVSSGGLFRELAKKMGLSLIELNRLASQNPEIDRMIDGRAREEARRGSVVIDGHLAAWVLKDIAHIKIYITAPPNVRFKRIAERDGKPINEVIEETETRERLELERFKRIYGIDVRDLTIFDLVVNNEGLTPEATIDFILRYIKLRMEALCREVS